MAQHWKQNLIIFSYLLLLAAQYVVSEDDTTPPNSEEEDDSSSEETVEDSNESRRRRSVEMPSSPSGENMSKTSETKPPVARAIPGFPDPATILKIAEILQTVGEKVVPILVEGNSAADLVAERVSQDFMFLKNFKKEIDSFTEELKIK